MTHEGPSPEPLLTVVVIVYNDADRLPAAVESVLAQTLSDLEVVIVDDASADRSAQVAEKLAARHERVRAHRLPANSGGCSRPRNVGIELARGRYVMFLDSDDTLPADACKVLVEAAEEAEADFSAGLCMRVHLNKGGRAKSWYAWLYTERRVYSSVLDNPDLLYDTLSTNKCYRRSFLDEQQLRFPEGYHYEDLLFSALAYVSAKRIALVPDVVYYWNVIDATDTPSISNRRMELRNFTDRVAIHRLIDAEFIRRGATELKLSKDLKFLQHDLKLYLNDLPYRDAEFRQQFLAAAKDYLLTMDERAFQRAQPVPAIAAWLILRDDPTNLFTVIDYIAHNRKLSTRLVEQAGRIYWCGDHLDTDDGRAVLDVTDLGFQRAPLDKLDLYNRVTHLQIDGTQLSLRGEILNQLGRIKADASLSLTLTLASRRRVRRQARVPVRSLRNAGDRLEWSADLDIRKLIRAVGFVDRVWDIRGELSIDGIVNDGRISAPRVEWTGLHIPVRPRLGRLAADGLETLVTPAADLAFEFVPGTGIARGIHRRGQHALQSKSAYKLRDTARRAVFLARHPRNPRLLEEVFSRTLLRLPRRRGLAVFESDAGYRYAGNPRAIYEETQRRGLPIKAVWAYADAHHDFPKDVRLVKHGSLAYFSALARADVWVDDRGFPREAVKRPGTTYVQSGHGTPLRWAGFDSQRMRQASFAARYDLKRQIDKWDAVVARAPYDAGILAQAYRLTARVLSVGYPRNDALVAPPDPDLVAALRGRLGIDADTEVVLHVPSCDATVFAPDDAVLGDDAGRKRVLIVRPGDLPRGEERRPIPTGERVVDASLVDDLTGLLLLADVLVTDHHSSVFDYPLRGRPVVLIGCSCFIRPRRGAHARAYFDIDAEGPGPTVWSAAELTAELSDLDALAARNAGRLERVVKQYGAYDVGSAAAHVVDFLYGESNGSGSVQR